MLTVSALILPKPIIKHLSESQDVIKFSVYPICWSLFQVSEHDRMRKIAHYTAVEPDIKGPN